MDQYKYLDKNKLRQQMANRFQNIVTALHEWQEGNH